MSGIQVEGVTVADEAEAEDVESRGDNVAG